MKMSEEVKGIAKVIGGTAAFITCAVAINAAYWSIGHNQEHQMLDDAAYTIKNSKMPAELGGKVVHVTTEMNEKYNNMVDAHNNIYKGGWRSLWKCKGCDHVKD